MARQDVTHRNEVVLVGRLTGEPETRELPSGDQITTWRLTMRRDADPARAGAGHDTVECTAWAARVRRSSASWQRDDLVEVSGALRRRFWQGPAGAQSRYAVEVLQARRLRTGRPRTPA